MWKYFGDANIWTLDDILWDTTFDGYEKNK